MTGFTTTSGSASFPRYLHTGVGRAFSRSELAEIRLRHPVITSRQRRRPTIDRQRREFLSQLRQLEQELAPEGFTPQSRRSAAGSWGAGRPAARFRARPRLPGRCAWPPLRLNISGQEQTSRRQIPVNTAAQKDARARASTGTAAAGRGRWMRRAALTAGAGWPAGTCQNVTAISIGTATVRRRATA